MAAASFPDEMDLLLFALVHTFWSAIYIYTNIYIYYIYIYILEYFLSGMPHSVRTAGRRQALRHGHRLPGLRPGAVQRLPAAVGEMRRGCRGGGGGVLLKGTKGQPPREQKDNK